MNQKCLGFFTARRRVFLLLGSIFVAVIIPATLGLTQARDPSDAPTKQSAKTFRLTDGTELPIEEWPETYETLEWQPPIDPKKAKVIVEYDPYGDYHVESVALDLPHRKVYWIRASGGARHGQLNRANLDGSNRQVLLDGFPMPDEVKELYYGRGLCVAPSLNTVFWTCRSPSRDMPGFNIYKADLDGKNYKAIITGLNSCSCVLVDETGRKIYYNDDSTIQEPISMAQARAI